MDFKLPGINEKKVDMVDCDHVRVAPTIRKSTFSHQRSTAAAFTPHAIPHAQIHVYIATKLQFSSLGAAIILLPCIDEMKCAISHSKFYRITVIVKISWGIRSSNAGE